MTLDLDVTNSHFRCPMCRKMCTSKAIAEGWLGFDILVFVCWLLAPAGKYWNSIFKMRTVPGSIPGRVTGDYSEASDKSMCPGSTQPFEMSTGYSLG
jgi:hypothetical protein